MSKSKKKFPRTDEDQVALQREQEAVARANMSLLKQCRQDADISQAQMGFALGVSGDVISNIENLKRSLSIEGSVVWARLTGLSVSEYFEELAHALRKLYPPPK